MSTVAEKGRSHRDTTHTQPQDGRAANTTALSSDNNSGLSDSDPELSSDDDGYSSADELGCSSTSKQSRWSVLDEQRLLAYNKKEDRSWQWIFRQFLGRT